MNRKVSITFQKSSFLLPRFLSLNGAGAVFVFLCFLCFYVYCFYVFIHLACVPGLSRASFVEGFFWAYVPPNTTCRGLLFVLLWVVTLFFCKISEPQMYDTYMRAYACIHLHVHGRIRVASVRIDQSLILWIGLLYLFTFALLCEPQQENQLFSRPRVHVKDAFRNVLDGHHNPSHARCDRHVDG